MPNENHIPTAGERIYYTGDMANQAGYGYVRAVETSKWGTNLTVELDEIPCEHGEGIPARKFVIPPASFSPGPGRRFWRYSEWRDDRATKIAASCGITLDEAVANMKAHGWDFSDR